MKGQKERAGESDVLILFIPWNSENTVSKKNKKQLSIIEMRESNELFCSNKRYHHHQDPEMRRGEQWSQNQDDLG